MIDENPDSAPIYQTVEDPLFRSYRGKTGSTATAMTYRLPVGSATSVAIRLYFAERFFTATGKRVFDVFAENQIIGDDVDIFARAGGQNRAYVLSDDTIKVTDGYLDLRFKASTNLPSLAAIEVFNTTPRPAGDADSDGDAEARRSDAVPTSNPPGRRRRPRRPHRAARPRARRRRPREAPSTRTAARRRRRSTPASRRRELAGSA